MGGTEKEHKDLQIDNYRADWESPRHEVKINKSFAISSTEVTVNNFAQFVKETERQIAPGCLAFPCYPEMSNPEYTMYQANLSWLNPGFKQEQDSPVACVTRKDAEGYAAVLSVERS